ncbi:MAG: Planctomycete cytochrome [Verrucomicrobiales bacterium]|nr:Planctomycete cytochrome [Verrucomicrobiales bacterium]
MHVAADEVASDFFERQVRPVLVERCYKCHSAQSEKIKGGLTLDTPEGWLKGGDNGPAVVPGSPEKSRLVEAIGYGNEDLQMPPKQKLTEEQIANLTTWIKMGAPAPVSVPEGSLKKASQTNLWAFIPPKPQLVPRVRNPSWCLSPIDNFILARLEAAGLQPAPQADKRTLLRRVTYDLTGLPPTAADVEGFLADKSRNAYSNVVERLLASPHYGERWARHWLDVARYADTKGYVYSDREEPRFVHSAAYRDWVISAFNQDMPYYQFLLYQIAADQLTDSPSNRENLAAMGFLTLGRRFLGVVHDIIDDRIDVVMRGTQGLTVACARCHDHKFDPIPTRDYYSLYGVFNGSYEKLERLDPATSGSDEFEVEFKKRTQKLQDTFAAKKKALAEKLRSRSGDYLLASLTADKLPSEEFYEIRGPDDLNPTFVRQWQSYLSQRARSFDPVFAPWNALSSLGTNEFKAKSRGLLAEIFENPALNPLVKKTLEEHAPQSMHDLASIYGKLLTSSMPDPNTVVETNFVSAREELRQVLLAADSPANVPAGSIADQEWFFDEPSRVELSKLQAEIERLIINTTNAPPFTMALEDRPVQKNPRVFRRGNPASRGDEVPRQFLQALSKNRKPFSHGSGRLELAQAIASPDNPLTARVMVNRIWLNHFGAGLVTTPSDFGVRSEPPSHPELLDWLALYFNVHGSSIKELHRLIVLSATYQQQSDRPTNKKWTSANALAMQKDPGNRLLWKMNRQRLEYEEMRDSLLAVSGDIDPAIGGKAVDLFKQPFSARRAIYGYLDRQFLPGTLRNFDFPNPDIHSSQRLLTTVPQQALYFMNSPYLAERSRRLLRAAQPPVKEPALAARISSLYRAIYQRQPSAREIELGQQFILGEGPSAIDELPKYEPVPWSYGYGEFDEASGKLTQFKPLPYFAGDAWQGGTVWPDEKLGWARLTADGGHTGNDHVHSVIRRWTAPEDGTYRIDGQIKHTHTEGIGVRARIIAKELTLLGTWNVHNSAAETRIDSVEFKKGDFLDFVAELPGKLEHNDFIWVPAITRQSGGSKMQSWNGKKDFSGPPEPPIAPLNVWERYAQTLLLANEFVFID